MKFFKFIFTIKNWLEGKKAYIISIIGMLSQLIQVLATMLLWINGDISLIEFVNSENVQTFFAWGSLSAIRAGVTKVGKPA